MMRAKFVRIAGAGVALALAAMASAQGGYNNDRDQDNRDRDRDRNRETLRDQNQNQNQSRDARAMAQSLELERVSHLLKTPVQLQDNQRAGRIEDFAVDPETGQIVLAIVNTQNVQQANDQYKAVPFAALNFTDNHNQARMDIDMNRWHDAPPFDINNWETTSNMNWRGIVFQHYGLNAKQTGAGSTGALVKATDLNGLQIRNRQRQTLGTLDDTVADIHRGVIVYGLLNPSADQARSSSQQQLVVVPWPAIREVRPGERVAIVDLDRGQLRDAPTFQRLQDLARPQFVERTFAFYNVQPEMIYGYVGPEGGRGGDFGGSATGAGGWDFKSQYGQAFDPNAIETVQGQVSAIETFTPMNGMAPGVRFQLRSANDNRTYTVHLGPAWYINHQNFNLREGDQVRVIGSRAQNLGQNVLMAIEVRRGNDVLLLRDRDGLPRWDASYQTNELQGQQFNRGRSNRGNSRNDQNEH